MSMSWTADQVLALAPDASSAKSGQGLANPRKWVTLGHDAQAVWGECQGSSKTPYRAQVDQNGPAFRCSCPSRKFPCKHAIGLLLLLVNKPEVFSETAQPDWVSEWISSRAEKAEKQETKKRTAASDPKAQAKRTSERRDKITAGLNDLERWVRDLIRQGLATTQGKPYSFWESTAARLVDAQAPGAARMVREMAGIPASGNGWQDRLLVRLGRLHLLIEGYKRFDILPPATQADIRNTLGWNYNQDEVLATESIHDQWHILGQHVEQEDNMKTQRTWLWGANSQQPALILDFAHGNQPLDKSLVVNTVLDAELAFFPSNYPLRALLKQQHAPPTSCTAFAGSPTVLEATNSYTKALARNPWIERFPLALNEVVPFYDGETWRAYDTDDRGLTLHKSSQNLWEMVATSGGYPIGIFGEWDGRQLTLLNTWG
ncbi:MAG: SWIM zinc finger family protein [Chloroflexi bacterium AL-W]|nr:SWIM zinc finger family protein [Chloroflexi bacterium AL-N1]NOK70312.1 SWIM zinc finger family protein [Chloroflexi bacterium AL-N10]NOK77990.1 SWIM zinc finger family protein [Chloroflexi bacterium AL-N5]NOK85089.1 SWIM zinc finger family protein [Chloroflexi bacterium AL-W]